jgi:hypothetical protein
VPPALRAKAAELLMRTNLQLTLGNFELDWDNGRCFFRVANLFENERPAAARLTGLVHLAVAETDRLARFLRELAATPRELGPALDVARLLRREDLLPGAE